MTVEELPYYNIQIGEEALGSEVARLFDRDKMLPGIIVSGPGQTYNLVARNQFYQRLGRLYGVEIYSPRPIGFFLKNLHITSLAFPAETTVQNAVVACLARGENVYDPFLVLLPNEPPRLVDFLALILKQTELLSVAQVEAQGQRTVAIAANNAKSEFLAVMSHELRTPLTAIIGYGEILLEDASHGNHEEVTPRVQNIVTAGLHLLEMINGILDLAKIEAGKTELSPEQFSLPDLLESLTGTIIPLVAKNDNEFSLISAKELGDMYCDETKLKQCLLNLLGNASKFTKNGRVKLQVSRELYGGQLWAIFEISDTGIGMTDVQMHKLFAPFYQADSSISRRFGGTGLGLSLTKCFCEMLGGTLSVKSIIEEGSIFTMRLPMGLEKREGNNPARTTRNLPRVEAPESRTTAVLL